jgi:hypothetical protein
MQRIGWYLLLSVVFLVIPGWVLFKTTSVMSEYAIDATEPFAGAAIPEGYERLNSISGKGGRLYEFYQPAQRTKFSLLVSEMTPEQQPLPDTQEGMLKALIARQNQRFTDQPVLSHFTQAYLGSAFDPQRAYEVAPLAGAVPAIKFVTNKGANYALSVWRAQFKGAPVEVALLGMKKNEPVSPESLATFTSLLRTEIFTAR